MATVQFARPDNPNPRHDQQREWESMLFAQVLVQPSILPDIATVLGPADWINPCFRWAYQAALDMREGGVDPEEYLAQIYDRVPIDRRATWIPWLADAVDACCTTANWKYYVRQIKEASIRRKTEDALRDHGPDAIETVGEWLRDEARELAMLKESGPEPTAAAIFDALADKLTQGKQTGFHPGFEFLRYAVRQITPGHLWIVGGYTSVGKSQFIIEWLLQVWRSGNPKVMICSTEMPSDIYMLRFLAADSGIPAIEILHDLTPDRAGVLLAKGQWLKRKPLWILDTCYEIQQIRETARRIKPDILIVDYLQNLKGQGSIYERMSQAAIELQQAAKELRCLVVAVSQISNEAQRNPSDPVIAFKGAGEIAAASDLAIWLARLKDTPHIEAQVRKNRHGPTGSTWLEYSNRWTRLVEHEPSYDPRML